MAWVLKVEEYGEVNYAIALASIPAAVSLLGLNTAVTVYLAKGEKELLYEANSVVALFSLFMGFLVAFIHPWSSLVLVVTVFYSMSLSEVLGRRLHREYGFMCVASRLAQIALSLLFYLMLGLPGVLAGYFLGYLALSYRFLRSLRMFRLKTGGLRRRLRFIVHRYGFGLVSSLSSYLDKLIVGALYGFYVLGLYQLGYQFLMFLSVIPGSLYSYLLPEEASGRGSREVALTGLGLSAVTALVVSATTPWILKTFFPGFREAVLTVRVMCIGAIPATVASLCNARLLGMELSRPVLMGRVLYLVSLVAGLTVLGIVSERWLALSVVIARTIQAIYLILWRR